MLTDMESSPTAKDKTLDRIGVAMENLTRAVYDRSSLDNIRLLVKQIPPDVLWSTDSSGLDIIQHTILADNRDCVSLISERSPIASRELAVSTTPNGYLHLACLVGHANAVAAICEGPDVNMYTSCEEVPWPAFDVIRHCIERNKSGNDIHNRLVTISQMLKQVTHHSLDNQPLYAIDVAALAGHIDCVRAILRSSVVKYSAKQTTALERAIVLQSVHAFRLLLTQKPDPQRVESAFRRALGRKLPAFVTAVLDYGVDVAHALGGVNPFHFVYLCTPTFHRQRASSGATQYVGNIDLLTELLIKRNFDINTTDPSGTFPLYSLLASLIQEKDYNPGSVPFGYIRTMEILLRAGARTDVDELEIAASAGKVPSLLSAQAGRELSTSVLNAYFLGLQASDTWRPHIAEHLDRICLTLLETGADAAKYDSTRSTPLHDLMKAAATQHALGHMHADLSTMSRMLLYFGANPNCVNAAGHYPVELYFILLLSCMGGLIAFRRWKATNNVAQVIHILYFMDADDACTVRRRILALLDSARSDLMPDDVAQFVTDMMTNYIFEPKSLQEHATLALWKAVGRRVAALKSVHMPRALFSRVSDLFMLDIQ